MEINTPSPQFLQLINQIFDLEKKVGKMENGRSIARNINRMKHLVEEMGYQYHNPIAEPYNDTRTDCDATLSGNGSNNLMITEVIKPMISVEVMGMRQIVQKAVVIVEGN